MSWKLLKFRFLLSWYNKQAKGSDIILNGKVEINGVKQ